QLSSPKRSRSCARRTPSTCVPTRDRAVGSRRVQSATEENGPYVKAHRPLLFLLSLSGAWPGNEDGRAKHDDDLIFEWPSPTGELGKSLTYTHGHHESVLRSHKWRTVENSAAYLAPSLKSGTSVLDLGCGPGTITADIGRRVAPGR